MKRFVPLPKRAWRRRRWVEVLPITRWKLWVKNRNKGFWARSFSGVIPGQPLVHLLQAAHCILTRVVCLAQARLESAVLGGILGADFSGVFPGPPLLAWLSRRFAAQEASVAGLMRSLQVCF